ncbi:MAG: FAD-binding domain [Acidobacteriota bacterium]
MKVLISGAGITGPTLAWWLRRYGVDVVIVEQASHLRTGGYVIDFWGAGFDIAERMSLLPQIREAGYAMQEVRIVDDANRRIGGFSVDVFRRLTAGRYVSLPRGDLASILFHSIENDAEVLFGETIEHLDDTGSGVRVDLSGGSSRDFDAVIGADGLHSRVRELAFGPESQFETYLGYCVAAFEVDGYRPRDELVFVMHTEVGRQVARFTLRGDRTMFLFIFKEQGGIAIPMEDTEAQKSVLRDRFRDCGWETAQILKEMDRAGSLYFDRVSQIRMEEWWRGRVALTGDAAFCVSLLGGQGSALAMIGAYFLAHELKNGGDPTAAFKRYHASLDGFLRSKQKDAENFAGWFAPSSRIRLFLRNQATKLLGIPLVADLAGRNGLLDRITLPPE